MATVVKATSRYTSNAPPEIASSVLDQQHPRSVMSTKPEAIHEAVSQEQRV